MNEKSSGLDIRNFCILSLSLLLTVLGPLASKFTMSILSPKNETNSHFYQPYTVVMGIESDV